MRSLVAALGICVALAVVPDARSRAVTRDCHYANVGHTTWVFGIQVVRTGGVSCSAGKRVLRHVGNWLRIRYYTDLGASRHRKTTVGYSCDVRLVGDSAWQIRCTRGSRVIVGFTAN